MLLSAFLRAQKTIRIKQVIALLPFLFLNACIAPKNADPEVVKAFAQALQNSGELASLLPASSPTPTPAWPSYAGFGFNAPWMYGVTHGPSSSIAELSEAARYLNLPIVRFPGGTVSRIYHFNLPGYDGNQSGETENYIVPFTKIFAPVGSAPLARISFLPNIDDHFRHTSYHGSDDDLISENLQTLKYLLDKNFKVEMVELGNEEYLTPELFWSFGNNPWKPIETADQNIQALVEIKLTYLGNVNYQFQHFQQGMDKYISLLNTYKTKINEEFDRRSLPRPKYGVSIPWTYSMTYSESPIWHTYYLSRIRDLRGTDALIPHYYKDFVSGNGASVPVDLKRSLTDLMNFFCMSNTTTGQNCPTDPANPSQKVTDQRKFWITEWSANEITAANTPLYDTPEQIDVFTEMARVFADANFKTEYFFLHQYFKDGADHGLIYKNSSTDYRPMNGAISNGVMKPIQVYGKSLYYSPRFCWAVKARGGSIAQYDTVKNNYGCR